MGDYAVIYADPPWSFKTYSDAGLGRSASAWYDTMTLEDIKSIPVSEFAAPDCVLLMWITDPFLKIGFDVIESWGFEYKTVGFVWAKCAENMDHTWLKDVKWPIGTGYWTRANPEYCLLATRGHPHRINSDVPELVIAPRREHSRKPDEMYALIERLCAGPYLELFARQQRSGWDCHGFESESGPLQTRRWKSTAPTSAQKLADALKNVEF